MRITLRSVPPALMDFLFIPCSTWETMDSQKSIWHWTERHWWGDACKSKINQKQTIKASVKFMFS
jgi:hypothetical protein